MLKRFFGLWPLIILGVCFTAGIGLFLVSCINSIGGHPRSYWVSRLNDADAKERLRALWELYGLPLNDSGVLNLVSLSTSDNDLDVRKTTAFILGRAAFEGRPTRCGGLKAKDERRIIATLQGMLEDQQSIVTEPVLHLRGMSQYKEGLVSVTRSLGGRVQERPYTEEEWARVSAAEAAADALAACGPKAIRPTIMLLDSPRPEVRRAALIALGMPRIDKDTRAISRDDAGLVAVRLRTAMSDHDEVVRRLAANRVWQLRFGPDEVKVLSSAIIEALRDEEDTVREAAAYSLGALARNWKRTEFGIGLRLSEEASRAVNELTRLADPKGNIVSRRAFRSLELFQEPKGTKTE